MELEQIIKTVYFLVGFFYGYKSLKLGLFSEKYKDEHPAVMVFASVIMFLFWPAVIIGVIVFGGKGGNDEES